MKDVIASSGGSSPAKERGGLSLSAVKALVLREKEDKLTSEFSSNEKVVHLINSLFDPGMCILGGLVMMFCAKQPFYAYTFPSDVLSCDDLSLSL